MNDENSRATLQNVRGDSRDDRASARPYQAWSWQGQSCCLAVSRYASCNRSGSIDRLNASRTYDLQAKKFLERIEVPVAMEQSVIVSETERSNQAVDRLPDRLAVRAEPSIVLRRCHGKIGPARREDLEASEVPKHASRFVVGRQALQNLADHEVEEAQPLTPGLALEPRDLRSAGPI